MQVFISWSGDTSKQIAQILEHWLPRVLQSITVFVSTGLVRGSLWAPSLASALEKSTAGFLCLTSDSINSPWVLFEAGALGMGVRGRPVFGVLFDVVMTDVPAPISQFQLSKFSKEECLRILKELNKLSGDRQISDRQIEEALEQNWAELDQTIQAVLSKTHRSKRIDFNCFELKDRAGLYDRIAEVLQQKNDGWVHDTTWGKNPPDRLTPKESAAFQRYVAARQGAMARGVTYKEMFSFTTQRLKRIVEAFKESQKTAGGYDVRVLEGMTVLSIPDFMVMDSGDVIISHVDAAVSGGKRKYLHIQCPSLADFYYDWFEQCWNNASPPDTFDN